MDSLSLCVVKGASSVRRKLPEETILRIVRTMQERSIVTEGYAFVSGRNAAIALSEREAAASRRILREEAARREALRQEILRKEEEGVAKQAILELTAAMANVTVRGSPRLLRWKQMTDAVVGFLAGISCHAMAGQLGVSPNVAQQWKRRVLVRCSPELSPVVKKYWADRRWA